MLLVAVEPVERRIPAEPAAIVRVEGRELPAILQRSRGIDREVRVARGFARLRDRRGDEHVRVVHRAGDHAGDERPPGFGRDGDLLLRLLRLLATQANRGNTEHDGDHGAELS